MRWCVVIAIALAASGCKHPFVPVEAAHLEAHAVAIGAAAPSARLTNASSGSVELGDVFRDHATTIVVFYRGFF